MRLVETYLQTGSITETARRWHTSRNVVRKWVERYRDGGGQGLGDRSRRPHRSPAQTGSEIEALVLETKKATGYGRKRLAWYLWREKSLALSPYTIRHILRRNGSLPGTRGRSSRGGAGCGSWPGATRSA